MPRGPRSGTPFQLYLQAEMRAQLEGQAEALGRSLQAEIVHAISRHLAAPPTLTTPDLPPASVSPPAAPPPPAPKKPVGRPRKRQ